MILSNDEVLALIPQQKPFRFIDKIHHIDDTCVKSSFTFTPDLDFYAGHFPGNPITPGVILVEAAAQMGIVSHGIWLVAKDCNNPDEINQYTTLFSEIERAEFLKPVLPGDEVFVEDIHLTGSLANFNWSEFSDFDLHVIVDFEQYEKQSDLYKELFNLKKQVFNDKHDIRGVSLQLSHSLIL